MKTIRRPDFKEVVVSRQIHLDSRFIFNDKAIGPSNFYGLRKANYGKGFGMPTLSDLTVLLNACFLNRDFDSSKQVVQHAEHRLTGNTAILYSPQEGMYVQDNPTIRYSRISMSKTSLRKKISRELYGTLCSEDGHIRFVQEGNTHQLGRIEPADLHKNHVILALFGGSARARKLTEICEENELTPYLEVDSINREAIVVPHLFYSSGLNKLVISIADSAEEWDRYSFGIKDSKTC